MLKKQTKVKMFLPVLGESKLITTIFFCANFLSVLMKLKQLEQVGIEKKDDVQRHLEKVQSKETPFSNV